MYKLRISHTCGESIEVVRKQTSYNIMNLQTRNICKATYSM